MDPNSTVSFVSIIERIRQGSNTHCMRPHGAHLLRGTCAGSTCLLPILRNHHQQMSGVQTAPPLLGLSSPQVRHRRRRQQADQLRHIPKCTSSFTARHMRPPSASTSSRTHLLRRHLAAMSITVVHSTMQVMLTILLFYLFHSEPKRVAV